MKKAIITLVVGITMVTFTSCKKWYTCTCYAGGTVSWTGSVEAITKAKAESIVQSDCGGGETVTCN